MPREGVPYPERLLCSLRCELKNIWNALNGKLHSVNGVEGDGQGNVNIVSGDAAVVVTPQPLSNQVEISLDQSQLPAAAVTSVNGETGAISLDASEIPYNDPDGYTDDVDEKLNVLTGVQNALQLSINQERTRAQNAESGLQTNINAANAAISLKVGGTGNIGSDTKPIKIVNGDAVAVASDLATQTYVSGAINTNNQYCLLTSGDQNWTGSKYGTGNAAILIKADGAAQRSFGYIENRATHGVAPATNLDCGKIAWRDVNNNFLGDIGFVYKTDKSTEIYIRVLNANGTIKTITLGAGNP